MAGKQVRQRFFVPKELHTSIALIVLWSFLAVVLIMYLVKRFGWVVSEHGIASFVFIMFGYAAVVVLLTVFFTKRIIGPFGRLTADIDLILDGQYEKRLRIRLKDDMMVRSFVDRINRALDDLERSKMESLVLRGVKPELIDLLAAIEKGELKEPEIRERLFSITNRINAGIQG